MGYQIPSLTCGRCGRYMKRCIAKFGDEEYLAGWHCTQYMCATYYKNNWIGSIIRFWHILQRGRDE